MPLTASGQQTYFAHTEKPHSAKYEHFVPNKQYLRKHLMPNNSIDKAFMFEIHLQLKSIIYALTNSRS